MKKSILYGLFYWVGSTIVYFLMNVLWDMPDIFLGRFFLGAMFGFIFYKRGTDDKHAEADSAAMMIGYAAAFGLEQGFAGNIAAGITPAFLLLSLVLDIITETVMYSIQQKTIQNVTYHTAENPEKIQHDSTLNGMDKQFHDIERNIASSLIGPNLAAVKNQYDAILKSVNGEEFTGAADQNLIKRKAQNHIYILFQTIRNDLVGGYGIEAVRKSIGILNCALMAQEKFSAGMSENDFRKAINLFERLLRASENPSTFLKSNGEGDVQKPFAEDNSHELFGGTAADFEKDEGDLLCMLRDSDISSKKIMDKTSEMLNKDFFRMADALIWYIAYDDPVDVNRLSKAIAFYDNFTIVYVRDEEKDSTVSLHQWNTLLAEAFLKKIQGGENALDQEIPYLDQWADIRISQGADDDCRKLASGFSMLGLFNMEHHILRKLAVSNVQLSMQMQTRLSFLEHGSEEASIYDVDSKGNTFLYDADSLDWDRRSRDLFFSKVTADDIQVHYSLLLDKTVNRISLQRHQSVSADALFRSFEELVKEYDDIVCRRTNAKALNMDNVEYKDAMLFQFTSERNRGASVLFYSEKYGRTLTITMLTMFTPDSKIKAAQLSQYYQAVRENINVESFKQSLLREVDQYITV